MTQRELGYVRVFISNVRAAINEVNKYAKDYESEYLKMITEELQESLNEFRKLMRA